MSYYMSTVHCLTSGSACPTPLGMRMDTSDLGEGRSQFHTKVYNRLLYNIPSPALPALPEGISRAADVRVEAVEHPGGQLANPLGHLHTRHVRATAERDLMIMSVT